MDEWQGTHDFRIPGGFRAPENGPEKPREPGYARLQGENAGFMPLSGREVRRGSMVAVNFKSALFFSRGLGHLLTSFIHQVADFVNSLEEEKPAEPTFEEAMRAERVVDAVLRSAGSHQWVAIA